MRPELKARLLALLLDLIEDSNGCCPKCGLYGGPHYKGCELEALIDELRKPGA